METFQLDPKSCLPDAEGTILHEHCVESLGLPKEQLVDKKPSGFTL